MGLYAIPTTLRKANDFLDGLHRHNGRTSRDGGKFAIACGDGTRVVGVAIVGNPVSATYMDGFTAEVLRVCVLDDAPLGSCSFLYGCCWRAWKAMGGLKLVTYTLTTESGASLRGAGWKIVGECKPHKRWTERSEHDHVERKDQAIYGQTKLRWEAQ